MITNKNYKNEMAYNWSEKNSRANIAKKHTENMAAEYFEKIKGCIENSVIYTGLSDIVPVAGSYDTKINVTGTDSVSAVISMGVKHPDEINAVLNFASYKNPGGMFINGSRAQEECLCHESFLYNVLNSEKLIKEFYELNRKKLNKALYTDRAIYTPDVLFTSKSCQVPCGVITCAAPNKATAQTYQGVSDETNKKTLESRIEMVLYVAAKNKVDNLILGAFGSGVFGQDGKEVAQIFKDLLLGKYKGIFKEVNFAILPGGNENLNAFQEVFADRR